VYKVTGELSQKNAHIAVADGISAILQGQSDFDFSELQRIDSATVAVMIEWQRRAADKRQPLQFHAVPATLLSLIQLYGLTEQFSIVPSERH